MNCLSAPLISVIVAVFNGRATLQQCIDSFARQTYANKELIVIDGGSTDGTIDVLRENQNTISYWVSEPDRGIYSAWNKALSQARGEWICFLGADDYFWDTNALAHMGVQLQKLPSSVLVAYGEIMVVNSDGRVICAFGGPWGKVKKRFGQLMSIPHQGTMHRRRLFERHGHFDESFRIAGDYELLLRELKSADACFIPDVVMTAMRQGGGISSTPGNSWIVLRETRLAQLKNGIYVPGIYWYMAVLRLCVRSLLWKLIGERLARKTLDLGRRMLGLPPFWTRTG
jgi:glycosyltransferase involved in cell wall biosynthesis